jgi:predicted amidohydrolase
MDIRKIAVISLSTQDASSFEDKLEDAAKWVVHAAIMGAQLAVLPEALNLYCGDGPGNPNELHIPDIALDDWQSSCDILVQTAKKNKIALTIPVFVRTEGRLYNSFFLISDKGECLGEYRKRFPTTHELDLGVIPASTDVITWNGLKIGGAICFDSMFRDTFVDQAAQGARLFLMPSLWPGGSQLNHWCHRLGVTCAMAYPAWSRIIDIDGKEKASGGYRSETLRFGFGSPVYCADINFDRECFSANGTQEKIVDIEKYYGERIKIDFDQQNCFFYIESLAPELSISDVKSTFDLISSQEYISNCRKLIEQCRP